MFATKLPFCSGGITHPLCCRFDFVFLKRGVPPHERCCLCSQSRQPCRLITSETTSRNPRVAHYNSMQSNGLRNLRLPFIIDAASFSAIKSNIKTFLDKTFLGTYNFSHACIQYTRYFFVRRTFCLEPALIAPKQN